MTTSSSSRRSNGLRAGLLSACWSERAYRPTELRDNLGFLSEAAARRQSSPRSSCSRSLVLSIRPPAALSGFDSGVKRAEEEIGGDGRGDALRASATKGRAGRVGSFRRLTDRSGRKDSRLCDGGLLGGDAYSNGGERGGTAAMIASLSVGGTGERAKARLVE